MSLSLLMMVLSQETINRRRKKFGSQDAIYPRVLQCALRTKELLWSMRQRCGILKNNPASPMLRSSREQGE
jgi:hypothetical protein